MHVFLRTVNYVLSSSDHSFPQVLYGCGIIQVDCAKRISFLSHDGATVGFQTFKSAQGVNNAYRSEQKLDTNECKFDSICIQTSSITHGWTKYVCL